MTAELLRENQQRSKITPTQIRVKEEESIEILKILGLITNIEEYQKKKFIEKINQNELVSKKHKKVCGVLSYIDHLLVLVSKVTGCFSSSAFVSLDGIPIGITSYSVRLKICVITAGIKKYNSIIKKKKKCMMKLNSIEVLMSKALTN